MVRGFVFSFDLQFVIQLKALSGYEPRHGIIMEKKQNLQLERGLMNDHVLLCMNFGQLHNLWKFFVILTGNLSFKFAVILNKIQNLFQ